MPVTFNVSNHNVNAPWWWKRLETALVFFLTGMIPLVGLTKSIPPDATHDITLVWLPGGILLVKFAGMLLGEPPILPPPDSGTTTVTVNKV
jgi:hypothetical protein